MRTSARDSEVNAMLGQWQEQLIEHAQNDEMVDTGYTDSGQLCIEVAGFLAYLREHVF